MKPDKINDSYYKATSRFIDMFYNSLKAKSLTMVDFCKQNHLDLYMTQKVMDKEIRMAVLSHFLIKLATLADVQKGIVIGKQPIAKHGIDYSQRKRVLYEWAR